MSPIPVTYARARARCVISICAGVVTLASFWAANQRAGVGPRPEPSTITKQRDTAIDYGKLPLSFESNQGQTDGRVKFRSRGPGYDVFLTSTNAVISLRKPRPFGDNEQESGNQDLQQRISVLYLKMLSANPNASASC
jgi:hypothetical protein